MEPVLIAEGISRSFGKVQAVRNLHLRLMPGEIYGLIGPDGAGKTTSLRTMIGAITPDGGDTIIQGVSVEKSPEKAREKIGYMPQAYGLYQDLTVQENLQFYGDLLGVPPNFLKERITEILVFIRLEQFRKRKVGDLSGGMYKKLAVACSIIHSPGVLILDEPTNGVDPVSRRDLWALLFDLSSRGVSILVSTPYMDEAERCHRVGLLMDGELIEEGEPRALTDSVSGKLYSLECSDPVECLHILKRDVPDLAVFQAGNSLRVFLDGGSIPPALQELVRDKKCGKPELVPPVFEDLFMERIMVRSIRGGKP